MVYGPAAKAGLRAASKKAAKRKARKATAKRSATYVARGAGTYTIRHVKRHAAAGKRVASSLRRKQIPNGADLLELIEGGAIYWSASKPVRKGYSKRRNRNGTGKRR
jgi:hypothetical protein